MCCQQKMDLGSWSGKKKKKKTILYNFWRNCCETVVTAKLGMQLSAEKLEVNSLITKPEWRQWLRS